MEEGNRVYFYTQTIFRYQDDPINFDNANNANDINKPIPRIWLSKIPTYRITKLPTYTWPLLSQTINTIINHMIKGKTLISQLLIIQIYKVTFPITMLMVYLHPKSYDIVLLICELKISGKILMN